MTAKEFKENRELLGLSQTEFAKKLGICYTAITKIEHGKRKITQAEKFMVNHLLKENNNEDSES